MKRSWSGGIGLLIIILLHAGGHAQDAVAMLNRLADRFVEEQLQYDPTLAYSSGLPTQDHSRFADRSVTALSRHDQREREELNALLALSITSFAGADQVTYANLRERLESDLQLRTCKTELWNVNHFDGWPSKFAEVAERQPVNSVEERKQAVQRWHSLPTYVNVEIANLKLGLAQGYSAPQSVVRRVIQQMDSLVVAEPDQSVFYSPARRSGDASFQSAFRQLIFHQINPALKDYRAFLQSEYLSRARESVAISDLPRGTACYQAFLRSNTTLMRTPQEIFDLGQKTVNENAADIVKIGEAKYHSKDLQIILAKIKSNPAEHFQSKEDLIGFSQQSLQRAKELTAAQLITRLPRQDVVIQPLSAFEDDAGVGSRFQSQPDPEKPTVFLIKLGDWRNETRADAEITTVHETVPGHYLQNALASELAPASRLSKFIDYAAYAEGWARYAEAMGEMLGSTTQKMFT